MNLNNLLPAPEQAFLRAVLFIFLSIIFSIQLNYFQLNSIIFFNSSHFSQRANIILRMLSLFSYRSAHPVHTSMHHFHTPFLYRRLVNLTATPISPAPGSVIKVVTLDEDGDNSHAPSPEAENDSEMVQRYKQLIRAQVNDRKPVGLHMLYTVW